MVVRARSQVTRALSGAAGALGFVAGHLSGVVGCDFCTGRTGNGCMPGNGGGAKIAVEVAGSGARCCGARQLDSTAPRTMTQISRATKVNALPVRLPATAFLRSIND